MLSGLLAQTGVAPLRRSYFVVASLAIGNLWLTWRSRHAFTPRSTARASLSITPKLALPSKTTRTPFLLASASAFPHFAAGSLLASLVPSLLYTLLPWQVPALPRSAERWLGIDCVSPC